MRHILAPLFVLALLSGQVIAQAPAQAPVRPATPPARQAAPPAAPPAASAAAAPAAQSSDDFVALFDGKTMAGWAVSEDQYARNFSVKDGFLHVEGTGG